MGGILPRKAQDRLLELIEREQLPGDVRDTLAGALSGDLRRQQLLFQAMIDTWPRLQKALGEIMREVSKANWSVEAWKARGKDASTQAEERADFVEDAVKGMVPRPAWGEISEEGLMRVLAMGYFTGHEVVEVLWKRDQGGVLPRAAKVVPARFYGYPYGEEDGIDGDRLMLNRDGGLAGYDYEDFPEHHFLIAVNGGHTGHPSIAAPLRALTGWWLAAVYGLKWLLNFAQLYGIPFRWATYSDDSVKGKVCEMLSSIGSAGWAAFPEGTKVQFQDASKSATSLPQGWLIEQADIQCDTFILGQTLTTSVGDSGSRALGEVHQEVRRGVFQGVADFVADVLNHQLVPSILTLNYGDAKEAPTLSTTFEGAKNEEAMAARDKVLFTEMGLPVSKKWLYERHGVPVPDEDSDDLFTPSSPDGAQGEPETGSVLPVETKGKAGDFYPEKGGVVQAREAASELSSNVLQDLTGVSKQWLSPVRPAFERLAALAMSKNVTDEDFVQALEKAQRELPELFDRLDHEALEASMTKAMSSAFFNGVASRY
ncbi:MAG: phage portal protein family protein [Verrucomicrobiales bacterium]